MKKALYIEDDAFFASTISKKLEEGGFQVDTAGDGKSGVTALKNKKYDVILLDLILPQMGGFDVLKELKSTEKNKMTPVIVLSNLSSESDKHKSEDLGARTFCVKMNTTPAKVLALVIEVTEHTG